MSEQPSGMLLWTVEVRIERCARLQEGKDKNEKTFKSAWEISLPRPLSNQCDRVMPGIASPQAACAICSLYLSWGANEADRWTKHSLAR